MLPQYFKKTEHLLYVDSNKTYICGLELEMVDNPWIGKVVEVRGKALRVEQDPPLRLRCKNGVHVLRFLLLLDLQSIMYSFTGDK